jgi:hypothetical protein
MVFSTFFEAPVEYFLAIAISPFLSAFVKCRRTAADARRSCLAKPMFGAKVPIIAWVKTAIVAC